MIAALITFTCIITVMVAFGAGFGAGAHFVGKKLREQQRQILLPKERRTSLHPPRTPFGDDY